MPHHRHALLLLTLLTLGACSTAPSPKVLAQRKAALDNADLLIVPGERIGPLSIGMSMAKVEAVMGPVHDSTVNYGSATPLLGPDWCYDSLNLCVTFAGPTGKKIVKQVYTTAFNRSNAGIKEERLASDDPVSTAFHLENGIAIGSPAHTVKMTYQDYANTSHTALTLRYPDLGLLFRVTSQEHLIVSIAVFDPDQPPGIPDE